MLRLNPGLRPREEERFYPAMTKATDHRKQCNTLCYIGNSKPAEAKSFTQPWPEILRMDHANRAKVDAMWDMLGL